MATVLLFLGVFRTHWKAVALSSLTLATGVWLGRHSVRCPASPSCPSCPEVHCAAAVQAPICKDSIRVRTRWITQPSTVAGCPPQLLPETVVAGSGVASTGASSASSESTPVVSPPTANNTGTVSDSPTKARWTALAGPGVTAQGNLALLGGALYNPFSWPVGVGVLLDVRPAAVSQSAVFGVVEGRF